MRFGQVLARCALAFDKIGDGVQSEPVHTHLQPELHDVPHRFEDGRVVVVQVRLMAEEAMPIIGLRERIPSPIRHFCINENDPDPFIVVIGFTPDVPIALWILARAS